MDTTGMDRDRGPVAAPGSGRIPCLDGLRAMSIALVLLSHARLTTGFPWPSVAGSDMPHLLGTLGVCLFFVISGYLISTLVLQEKEQTGTISLKLFYTRRGLRIFPAYYLYLSVALLLTAIGFAELSPIGFLASATYWRNLYAGPPDWIIEHTWSLSIEEQFYLTWPLCLRVTSRKQAACVALVGILGWPVLRYLRHGFAFAGAGPLALQFAAHDTILYGCLLALATRPGRSLPRMVRLVHIRGGGMAAILLLGVVYSALPLWPTNLTFSLIPIRNITLTYLVWWCVCNGKSTLGRLLETPPLVWVGVVSYSLYLWQQVFLFPGKRAWVNLFPQNLVFVFLAAWLSYSLVERPLNRLRHRFSVPVPAASSSAPATER